MRRIKWILFVAVLILFASCAGKKKVNKQNGDQAKETKVENHIVQDFVFGDDRPFAQCHASTLVKLNPDGFLVAWFAGTEEKNPDVGIWVSSGKPGHWTPPVQLAKVRQDAHWNPVLFRAPNGEIHLFFKVGKTIDKWETWVMVSADEGKTWSKAHELVSGDRGGRGPVKNKPIVLSDGTWLAGASDEPGKYWDVFVDRSEDSGHTWKATEYLEIDHANLKGKGVIQPTLWESEPGKVHMLVRSSEGYIYRSDSEDFGITWNPLYKTELANPNSGIDLVRMTDGTLVLAYNPDSKNWGARAPLTLALSFDNGKTWPEQLDIETGGKDDEFSYPSIVSWADSFAVVYTWQRQRVRMALGTPEDIGK